MNSSTFHCSKYRDSEDGDETISNESTYDENGNILSRFDCRYEGSKDDGKVNVNDLKLLVSQHIETMFSYFSGESLKYIRKLLSFKIFINDDESIYDSIERFENEFIGCMKGCLQQTNNFRSLCKLREGIESVLILMNSLADSNENDQVDKNLRRYKMNVLFGLLLDVELLSSCYQMETLEVIQNRLSKHTDSFLGDLKNHSIAIFYSTEFLNLSATRDYAKICVPILEEMLLKDPQISSGILLFKLWASFPSDLRRENIILEEFSTKKIREEDMVELRKLSTIFSAIPKNCENIAELFVATEINLTEAIQEFSKIQEDLFGIQFTIAEVESEDDCANLNVDAEKNGERVTVPTSRVVDSEHDYCCRFTPSTGKRKRSSQSLESTSPEPSEDDEYLQTNETVEVELCDLCVELGTMVIDSHPTDITPCSIKSLKSSSLLNEDEINPSSSELASKSNLYFTDPVYQLHCDTCEADEKCFSEQYDYILACRSSVVDIESIRVPKMVFSEELRCQCLSCHNNLECLKKNLSMLTEYAREREEKIEELTADNTKPAVAEFNDSTVNYQGGGRIPPEYKRSASETLEHKLPLKKRKFSFD